VAFTLIEILAAVTLMSIIVLGLLSMFNQTQRAFRGSMAQVDVLESGRLATDMLARELEQMTPSECPGTNGTHTINFFTFVPSPGASMLQGLPGTTLQRTNILQGFFYLTRVNQDWIGTGYQVLTNDANAGVGTLYRFSATNRSAPYVLSGAVANALSGPTANLSRIADGVVHLRLSAFATNGYPLTYISGFTNAVFTNTVTSGYAGVRNSYAPSQDNCYFWSNAVPAYVELELGILESQTLERLRSLAPAPLWVQQQYFSNHVAQVHIFRQRVPVRNVDISAYQ
jgi:type II secretory pathway pseudopilin PulG